MSKLKTCVIEMLESRGVKVDDIAQIVLDVQLKYDQSLSLSKCADSVEAILEKREVQFNILTGIALDILTEKNLVPEPLCTIIRDDHPLYGVDEVLAMGIANIYGSIGVTNFGYLDKEKPGIAGVVNDRQEQGLGVNTFLDDIISGLAGAACARVAHQRIDNGLDDLIDTLDC